MKESLVSYSVAKLAKEKGFDIPCTNFIPDESWGDIEVKNCYDVGVQDTSDTSLNRAYGDLIPIPTQALLQKWLREIHAFSVFVTPESISKENESYLYHIYEYHVFRGAYGKSYEQALEHGLSEALKLI